MSPVGEVHGHRGRFALGPLPSRVELYGDAGVLDDDGPARGRPVRVQRYERAAGLEHAEQPDDHVGGAFQGDADHLLGGESEPAQAVGQLGGERGDLAVGQGAVFVDDGEGVRPGPCLLAEQLHQGRAYAVGAGVVPPGQFLAPCRGTDRCDGAEGPVGEVGEVVQGEPRLVRCGALGQGDGSVVGAGA